MRRALPSAITLAGAGAALVAMLWAEARPYAACCAIIVAALCDMIDGRVARWLDAKTELGGHLDSLVDVIAFGVAPALVAYHAGLADLGQLAGLPLAVLPMFAFVAASALRLARFATLAAAPEADFVGVPTPAAALLVTTTVMASIELGRPELTAPGPLAALVVVVAGLMIAPIGFPSLKRFRSRALQVLYFATMAGGVTMLLVGLPGGTVLLGFLVLYLVRGAIGAIGRAVR